MIYWLLYDRCPLVDVGMDFLGGEDEQLSTLWSFFQEYFAYILEHTQLNISKFAIIATSLHYHILKDVMIIKIN